MTTSEAAFLMDMNSSSSVWNTTTTTTNHTLWTYCDNGDSCYVSFAHFVHMMDLVAVPIIIGIGVIGNAISFLVFTCTYLRHVSSSIYLAALAVVDTLYLCVLFFSWLVDVGIQVNTGILVDCDSDLTQTGYIQDYKTKLSALSSSQRSETEISKNPYK